MHSEIEKFWRNKGYSINIATNTLYKSYYNDDFYYVSMAIIYNKNRYKNCYYFNGKEYTEKEMLKIIKLVAFL